jgi:hypothetical protein
MNQLKVNQQNNGPTDGTMAEANLVAGRYLNVRAAHIGRRGRGGALKHVWQESTADIVRYMDVDLSAGLESFVPMIEALWDGGFDLATGSRLQKPKLTRRRTRFSDAQCGFKAITRQTAERLLPIIEDNGWFFDTELLVAERFGYRILDLPVSIFDWRLLSRGMCRELPYLSELRYVHTGWC